MITTLGDLAQAVGRRLLQNPLVPGIPGAVGRVSAGGAAMAAVGWTASCLCSRRPWGHRVLSSAAHIRSPLPTTPALRRYLAPVHCNKFFS